MPTAQSGSDKSRKLAREREGKGENLVKGDKNRVIPLGFVTIAKTVNNVRSGVGVRGQKKKPGADGAVGSDSYGPVSRKSATCQRKNGQENDRGGGL